MENKNNNSLVYIPMRADIVHPALIKIIDKGASLGRVIIGLLTDEAICSYTRPLNYLFLKEKVF